jgi:hypothetical protein
MSLLRSDDSRERRKSNRSAISGADRSRRRFGIAELHHRRHFHRGRQAHGRDPRGTGRVYPLVPAALPRGSAHRRPARGAIRAAKLSRLPLSTRRISARKNRIRANLPAHRITFNFARGSHHQNTKKSDRLGKAAIGGGARAPEVQPEGTCVVPRTTSPPSSLRS